ncbi:conserved hypothetical protein [uncultured Desulfobacterium sp.]|uniref:DUF2333 family protein n=1 Tax=uncultured Desulfobacterium sp. TaxID=201089 RepID=A0A445MU83_9BACT|nr:conserved hypothetical protein [uncultured Desulfobacterium sp.]
MEDNSFEISSKSRPAIYIIILVIVVFTLVVMAANSVKPGRLSVDRANEQIKGAAFIKTNQAMIGQLSDNWLPNDLFWPTVLLDNMPNFQLGQLEAIRYNVRVLRDNLSRMRTTDKLDPSAEGAFTALSNDPKKWWMPSAESRWRKAYADLETFYQDLASGKSYFYPRADNLVELLNQYASLMGGANTRLIHAPRDINHVLADDQETKGDSQTPGMVDVNIPWQRIDDNFYYAQGIAYALYESFTAIRSDFIDILTKKNSLTLVDKIIQDLERCYFEPIIVFNGDPESIFANHSLNLSGIFNDARQKINSLIVALTQG